METTLKQYTVKEVCDGFIYNESEGKGLFGLSGRLTIQLAVKDERGSRKNLLQ